MSSAERGQSPRVAVYSSVFGGFERIWPPVRADEQFDYFVVTDEKRASRFGSQVLVNPEDFESARLANRYQKMLFHESLEHFDFSIYMDGNVRQLDFLAPLIREFAASGRDIGLYPHYARRSVAAEIEACTHRGKIERPETARFELEHYKAIGFEDEGGMWEGSVVVKNHRSPALHSAMKDWWALYNQFRTRDQFSLPFVIWKHNLQVYSLDDAPARREQLFLRLPHASEGGLNKFARYARAKASENGAFRWLIGGASMGQPEAFSGHG